MKIPKPKFKQGDIVVRLMDKDRMTGVIQGRSFDSLLHAKQWKYTVIWMNGRISHHHYCGDLERV